MTEIFDARRATVTINLNGVDITTELSRFLIEFTYRCSAWSIGRNQHNVGGQRTEMARMESDWGMTKS
ncbi:hypothetical protein P7H22_26675 [Paenibacillus larvae]|nr:hypothetical protein [Paenibacillus larvae]MDT2243190.1 hypothetical protein [Paenibacillus larvae]